jgi:hypothetical protein
MPTDHDIVARARELRLNHPDQSFNADYAKVSNIQLIARRFTEHKRTNVQNIKHIETAIQYMICAKIVGDRRLYKELNEFTGEELDKYCEDIEIQDDCHDGFNTAVERHLYRYNQEVYEYLHSKRIKILDAGLVKYGGNDIFLPGFNAVINVRDNHRCLKELKEFVDNTPLEDRRNNENTFKLHVVKKFIVYERKLYVSNKDSDPVELRDAIVDEYLCDAMTDPDNIYMSKFHTNNNAGGNGQVTLHRQVPIGKLKNFTELMIKNGIVYHDEARHIYRIMGNYELMHLIKYEGFNTMSLLYTYNAKVHHPDDENGHEDLDDEEKLEQLKDDLCVDKVKLSNISRVYSPMPLKKFEEEYGEKAILNGRLYLFKGRSKVAQVAHRDSSGFIEFEEVQELLDKTL